MWQQFSVDVEGDPARVEAWLEAHGALAVTLEPGGADEVLEPAPGATPLWTRVRVVALFEDDVDAAATRAAFDRVFPCLSGSTRWIPLADRAWEREWETDFRPLRFGRRLWIAPTGQDPGTDGVVVRLDPGLAFGTGRHATTALCLEWLDAAELAGRTVLDYGCGSGVLAIAALRLGAGHATATDIDPQALTATADNAARNDVGTRITVLAPDELDGHRFDVVMANILAGPLVDLAPTLAGLTAPGGHVVLSGMLDTQLAGLQRVYADWFDLDPPALRDGWARLDGRRHVHAMP